MNKIDSQLQLIKERGTIGLMTHVVIGYPTLDATVKLVGALEKGGSDFIELQIPFSDPIADGPTIMEASDTALRNGVTTQFAMKVMKECALKTSIPLLYMCYFNTIFAYGVEKFCKDASANGASGLIVPDLPPEEERFEKLTELAERYNLYLIRVISPASSEKRIIENARIAKGFIYCVSRYGVTGKVSKLNTNLKQYLEQVKKNCKLPRAVGFGISSREQVKLLSETAEIAVIGSAIIEKLKKYHGDMKEVSRFISALRGD
jgi:tryptophan synthase alpha subunit